MKNIMLLVLVLCLPVLCLPVTYTSAARDPQVFTTEPGNLYINDVLMKTPDSAQVDGITLFPLRSAFESLGANVLWIEESNEVAIEYLGEFYLLAVLHYDGDADYPTQYFSIKNVNTNAPINLTSMTPTGGGQIINNRIFLYQEGATLLLHALDCTIEFENESRTIRINQISTESSSPSSTNSSRPH